MRWRRARRGPPKPPEPPGSPPVSDDTPTDPVRIFAALARHRVAYAAVGGIAVQAHGHVRATNDVDIVVAPEPQNIERLAAALAGLRARLLGVDAHLLEVDPTDPDDLREGANFALMTLGGRLDLWTDPAELKGAAAWPELRARRLELPVAGTTVYVVGRDDLISMKRAADRTRDREDIAALTRRAPDPGAGSG